MPAMGESRQELLAWVNDLLQLNITKVEQMGTGAAYCQIYDSIYNDVAMPRVKFNVNTEYGYIQNMKVLQNCFTKHKIDRTVPVEALIKCKMQDNLEFLQWTKRYWDQYFPGGEYDAIERRKAAGAPAPAVVGGGAARAPASSMRTSGGGAGAGAAARRAPPAARPKVGGAGPGTAALSNENNQLKETVASLERERDFYFSKLRDIELLVQNAIEIDPEIEKDEEGIVKHIQAILYSTEEGFEIPQEEGEVGEDDLETF